MNVQRPDLLCTEGLLEGGVVDIVFNDGWRRPLPNSLRAAQHGIDWPKEDPRIPLPNVAVIAAFMVHFPAVLERLARENPGGRYILVLRDGDPSVCEGGGPSCNVRHWPNFIHHIFAINVLERSSRVTPMPGAFWAFWDYSALDISTAIQIPRKAEGRVLVCHRHDGGAVFKEDHERVRCARYFAAQPWATTHPKLVDLPSRPLDVADLWPHMELLKRLRAHDYHAVPVGYGVERTSSWEAMALGTIPISLRHPELLHFADMPYAFVDRWENVTPAWCDANLHLRERSIEKLTLSYWLDAIREKRKELALA